jgi:hypothetical protein
MAMFSKIDKLTKDEVEVIFTVSADIKDLPENMSKYIISETK